MTKTVNIHEAKTHLSRLLEEAMAGEDIVIAKAGKPKVRLVPVEDPPKRELGFMEGWTLGEASSSRCPKRSSPRGRAAD